MIEVLHRYRIVMIIASLLVLGLIAWFLLSRQDLSDIPSRGVFVGVLSQDTTDRV